jgi:hypothetical protein
MKRSFYRIPLNESQNLFKYIIKYEEAAGIGTWEYKMVQRTLLQDLLDNPGLLECGNQPFQELKMHHDGFNWVIELVGEGT